MSLFSELKRRNVFRVGLAYIVSSWLIIEVSTVIFEIYGAPGWLPKVLVALLLVGLPVALVISWVYELTPEGIRRESEVEPDRSITNRTARKLDFVTIGVVVLGVAFLAADRFLLEPRSAGETPSAGSEGDRAASRSVPGGRTAGEETPGEATSWSVPGGRPAGEETSGEATSWSVPGGGNAKETGKPSVAVLPFVNMSDDADNEYFSDGISEELLNLLVGIGDLRVPSRTSSFTFKGSDLRLSEIGRELGVDHILEGSVRKAGNRIRVTAQLIDVHTDSHLWSETFTRELTDIFAVQDEIAQAIVGALEVTLTGEEQARIEEKPTDDVEAYNLYLRGRHLWNQRSTESLLASLEPLREAVELDPDFGAAWAALADTYALLPEYQQDGIDEYIPKAKQAIERALEINPDSARALTTRGYVRMLYDYDLDGARADYLRAIELMPDYATAHQWYGELLAIERRFEEAIDQFEIAASLDPLAPIMWHVAGWIMHGSERYDEALEYYDKVFAIDPDFKNSLGNMMGLHMVRGELDLARQYLRRLELDPEESSLLMLVIDALEDPSKKARAIEAVLASDLYPGLMGGKADLIFLLGEEDLALDYIVRAFEEGDPYAIHLNRLAALDHLRDDPRIQALLARMNLPP